MIMASDSFNRALQNAFDAANVGQHLANQIMMSAMQDEIAAAITPRHIEMHRPPGVPDVDARDRETMFALYEAHGIPRADVVAWYEAHR